MDEFLDSSSNVPDTPTPINSAGNPSQKYRNAAGDFDLKNKYGSRKVKSRKDSDQPTDGEEPMRDGTLPKYGEGPLPTGGSEKDDATKRYFGDFSIESKRNVMDLLSTHPMFDTKGSMRMNRVQNNTREVMPNDETKTVENGGYLIRQNLPQASQKSYGTKNHGS
jgi:hypothetical protein